MTYSPSVKLVPCSLLNSSRGPFSIRPWENSVALSERISEACEVPAEGIPFLNLKIRLLCAAKYAAPPVIVVATTVLPACSIPPVSALHPALQI